MPEAFLELPNDPIELAQEAAHRSIGDGLPIVAPTEERLARMIEAASVDPDHILGWMPPAYGEITARYIAINAIMAGCCPDHMPLLIAVAKALLEPKFNLYGIQMTTAPTAPLVVVHGPIAKRLGVNAKEGAFGPGVYANAVIGRAVRLMLMNLGGGIPGQTDRSTHGQPAKFTFCVAENEDETPWDPFYVRQGLTLGTDAVTVFGIQSQHNIIDFTATDGFEVLQLLASAMAMVGTNNITHGGEALVVIPPQHALQLKNSNIDYETATQFVYERARLDITKFPEGLQKVIKARRPAWIDLSDCPVTDRYQDIQFLVVGGAGIHAQFLPSFGATRAVTVPI